MKIHSHAKLGPDVDGIALHEMNGPLFVFEAGHARLVVVIEGHVQGVLPVDAPALLREMAEHLERAMAATGGSLNVPLMDQGQGTIIITDTGATGIIDKADAKNEVH